MCLASLQTRRKNTTIAVIYKDSNAWQSPYVGRWPDACVATSETAAGPVGLTQEQLAEHLEIDTLTVSRYETGNILPPLTVADTVARLLNTTIADLLGEAPVQPVEHADRIGIWLAGLPLSDRDWIERVVKQLVERCQPRKRGRPRTRPKA